MRTRLRVEIRPAGTADLPPVFALLRHAGLPTADLAGNQRIALRMAETQGLLLGVIALERFEQDGLLRSLAVAPQYRHYGVGKELVGHLEQAAQLEGIARLVLLTQTAESFFSSLGYRVIERASVSEAVQQSAEFRSLCPASAVCMTKTLQG